MRLNGLLTGVNVGGSLRGFSSAMVVPEMKDRGRKDRLEAMP